MPSASTITPDHFTTFGELLKFLRRRASLTQLELSISSNWGHFQEKSGTTERDGSTKCEQSHCEQEDFHLLTPVVVAFPLRGEWLAPNTPGKKVPSHGTDLLGARYAYDFVGLDPNSRRMRFYRPSLVRFLISGVRLQGFFGWSQPIFSATAGTVVQAQDGAPERDPVHPIRDSLIRVRNARAFQSNQAQDFRILSGNFIIIESGEGYVVYAHAQTGSILVAPGEQVVPGQQLAKVGHSGNSTAPHLHFQLMDHPDPWKAQGLPCCFRDYEVYQDGAWRPVRNGIPKATDRIRKG